MASDNKHNQLFAAIKKKDTERVRTLISNGATVNLPNKKFNGNTALHWAAKHSSTEIIGMILNQNTDINAVNDKGRAPLHVAIRYSKEKVKIVEFLLERGADVNMKNRRGNTPLYCVILNTREHINRLTYASEVDINVLSTILKYNPDINAVNDRGLTALHRACIRGLDPVIKLLLEHNADANCEDQKGWTPLFYTYKYYNVNSGAGIKWLLEHNADTCHITKKGYTLLHYLARTELREVADNQAIECLIDHNLEILTICDKRGRSALHVANQVAENYFIVDLLMKYGVDIYLLDNNNRDPLHYLLKNNASALKHMEKIEEYEKERGENISFFDDIIFFVERDEWRNKLYFTVEARHSVREHMIALNCIELLRNNNNFFLFVSRSIVFSYDEAENDDFDPYEYEYTCDAEIERLKIQTIGKNNITLYDFIKQSAADAAKYANNMEIRQLFQSRHYDKEFPAYIGIAKYRFAEGVAWSKLLKTIPPFYISRAFHPLPDECVDMILRNLSYKELKTFISAIKPSILNDCQGET